MKNVWESPISLELKELVISNMDFTNVKLGDIIKLHTNGYPYDIIIEMYRPELTKNRTIYVYKFNVGVISSPRNSIYSYTVEYKENLTWKVIDNNSLLRIN